MANNVRNALAGYLRARGKSDSEIETLVAANLEAASEYLDEQIQSFTPEDKAEELRAKHDLSYVLRKAYHDLKTWSASL